MRSSTSLAWLAAAVLLIASASASTEIVDSVEASVNPTTFPFQQCVQTLSENRWRVQWHNYTEDAYNGSELCFDLIELPLTSSSFTCKSNKRCCGTGVNKFKWYPAAACQRQVEDITFNGATTDAVYYEDVGTVTFIGKIVNLNITDLGPAGGLGGTLCFTLKGTKNGGTCPTFNTWMSPVVAAQDVMPIALYDHKNDNYECCPVTVLADPSGVQAQPPSPPFSAISPPPYLAPVYPPSYANSPPPAVSKASPPPKFSPPPKASSPPPKVVVVASPPPAVIVASPPAGPVAAYVYRNSGSIYTFFLQNATFAAAEAACTLLTPSAHLASINSKGEMYNVGTAQRNKVTVPASMLVSGNIAMWVGLEAAAGAAAPTSWTDGTLYNQVTSFTATHAGSTWPPMNGTCVVQSCSLASSGTGGCNWLVSSCSAPVSGYICKSGASRR